MASIAVSSAKSEEMEPAVVTHLRSNRALPVECAPVMPGMQMHAATLGHVWKCACPQQSQNEQNLRLTVVATW